jgi:hypothetical protein
MSLVIDCLRNRFLGDLSICAECAPEPEDCGPCRRVSCNEELAQAREALRALTNGAAVQEISEGDRRIRYYHSAQSIQCLKENISELEMKCGGSNKGVVYGCDPCGNHTITETFERVRPPPICVNTRRWIR